MKEFRSYHSTAPPSGASVTATNATATMNGDIGTVGGDSFHAPAYRDRGVTRENPDHVAEYVAAAEDGDAASVGARSGYARSVRDARSKWVTYTVRRPLGSRKGSFQTPRYIHYVVGGIFVGVVIFIIAMSSLINSDVEKIDRKYLVYTSKCKMPDIDHYPPIKKSSRPAEPIVCADRPPLTYTARRQDGRHVLHVDMAEMGRHAGSLYSVRCCYSVIERVDDVEFSEGMCINFEVEAVLETTTEFVHVKCIDSQQNLTLYANMHAVVQKQEGGGVSLPTATSRTNITSNDRKKRDAYIITSEVDTITQNESSVKDAQKKDSSTDSSPRNITVKVPERPSVLLLGVDSMSRGILRRTMPLTVKYLQENHWIDFVAFNKIGVNTAPNLVAAYTGNNERQSYDMSCWPPETGHLLDRCPFIWQEFKQQGYTTSCAEETSSSFRYPHASGFKQKPFDFYLRPFLVAAETLLPKQMRGGNAVCLGPTPTVDHVVNYTLDVVRTHAERPLFVLNWLSRFSHVTPSAVDGKFVRFLDDLSAVGDKPFNDAIVIFFSDHGSIFGELSKAKVGWYESRLPLLYVWVPEWFKVGYPFAYQSLKENAAKLVSPYDLYLTLRDIVDGRIGKPGKGCAGCRSCGSLFYPVVADRGCEEAGIPEEWCTCKPQEATSTMGKVVQNAPELVIGHINNMLAEKNLTESTCAVLKFNSMHSARVKYNEEPQPYNDYVIVFDTLPGRMVFDTTVRYFRATKTSTPKYQLLGTALRVDSYTNTSNCMELINFKPYCYCL